MLVEEGGRLLLGFLPIFVTRALGASRLSLDTLTYAGLCRRGGIVGAGTSNRPKRR